MRPVGGHSVRSAALCVDGVNMHGVRCAGWQVSDGMEIRCLSVWHETAKVATPVACKLAGVTYRQFDYWVRKGYLRGQVSAPGSGIRQMVADAEVAVARLMGVLVADGMLPARAAVMARDLWGAQRATLGADGLLDVTYARGRVT